MYLSLVLLPIMAGAIYLSYKNLYKTYNFTLLSQNKYYYLTKFSTMCILIPLFEEILYRYALKHYLEFNNYDLYASTDMINAVLFGLMHAFNILFVPFSMKYAILYQVFATTYLGYYILTFDTFFEYFMLHASYNFTIWSITELLLYYNLKNSKLSDNLEEYAVITKSVDDFNIKYGKYAKYRKTNEYGGKTNPEFDCVLQNLYICNFVKKDKLSVDMIERWNQYDKLNVRISL